MCLSSHSVPDCRYAVCINGECNIFSIITSTSKAADTSGQHPVGSDAWLRRELRGATFFDSCVIAILKAAYLSCRLGMRLLIGRERRNQCYLERQISFRNFLYDTVEFLRLDNTILAVFTSEKYDFQFYSRITRKINNFRIDDMYKSMVAHEDDIVGNFTPKAGDVVVDAGAAFGFYTILASRLVGPSGKIISIEPQPEIFEMLKRNIKLNDIQNAVSINRALYSKEAVVKLFDNYSLVPERAQQANVHSYAQVKADTLDNLLGLQDLKKVDWIKIDVEGAELEVLKGSERTLANNDDLTLVIEIHGSEMLGQITEFLKEHNFRIILEKMSEKRDWGHIVTRK
jgi:FkbM family methyltransferase